MLSTGLEHGQVSLGVDVEVVERVEIAVDAADLGREVEDDVLVAHDLLDHGAVADIAVHHLSLIGVFGKVEEIPTVQRRNVVEYVDLSAGGAGLAHDSRTDHPGTPVTRTFLPAKLLKRSLMAVMSEVYEDDSGTSLGPARTPAP